MCTLSKRAVEKLKSNEQLLWEKQTVIQSASLTKLRFALVLKKVLSDPHGIENCIFH